MTSTDFLTRLFLAVAVGLCIGFERQWRNKTAGIKTNMLVSTGSAIFVLLSILITEEDGDVTRIIAMIVSGVGFLGAGVIFREGANIHGLGSAATIWCSAAIGSMAGAGFLKEAIFSAVLVVGINIIIEPLDKWLRGRK
ncbi:MgtC/SapB family protein [Flagellimonas nanhaiensis]|uniref:MgtC/SapB family protein n=1 Tax=Flagellimonas nanhaiensis TaxID=2292706 RepID=A0A371JN18_9FLAO|nr:MgtC/SapB family protein [Allomuricauda nanhaiensis]RDY58632.1 MgtC/SapB family protein [Allomuricauda nanhaiensis]